MTEKCDIRRAGLQCVAYRYYFYHPRTRVINSGAWDGARRYIESEVLESGLEILLAVQFETMSCVRGVRQLCKHLTIIHSQPSVSQTRAILRWNTPSWRRANSQDSGWFYVNRTTSPNLGIALSKYRCLYPPNNGEFQTVSAVSTWSRWSSNFFGFSTSRIP